MGSSAVTWEVSLHLGAMTSDSVLESLPPVTRGASAFFFFTVSNVFVALLGVAGLKTAVCPSLVVCLGQVTCTPVSALHNSAVAGVY